MAFTHARKLGWGATIALLAATTTLATALADTSTFLLQLGSFNSEQQATQRWDEAKSKNADLLGKLTLHIEEVPAGNNGMLYRTQAGPIASHNDAASVCSSLQSRGVDCYVVETALFTPETPAVKATAAAQEMPSPPPSLTEASPSAAPAAPLADLPPAAPVGGASSSPAAAAAPAPSAPPMADLPPPAPKPSDNAAVVPPPAPALAGGAAPSEKPPEIPIAAAPAPAEKPLEVVAAAPAPMPAPSEKPPETVMNGPEPTPPAPTPAPAPEPVAAAPAPAPVHHHKTAHAAPAEETTTASSTGADQPVPGREPKFLNSGMPQAGNASDAIVLTPPTGEVAAAPQNVPAPSEPEEKPGIFTRVWRFFAGEPSPTNTPQPTANGSMNGNVDVAEAIRVPLGSDKKWSDHAIQGVPAVHAMSSTPSEALPKSYWAQLSYFADEAQARGFYDNFRTVYPQLSDGVRLRITKPFSSGAAAGHVSLRMGPFAEMNSAHVVCTAASKYGVGCTAIRDLGAPSVASAAMRGVRPHAVSAGAHWVQFGSYRTAGDAWSEWERLSLKHKKELRNVHAAVTTPAASSAMVTPYRLRAGPYANEADADALCNALTSAYESCVVIDNW